MHRKPKKGASKHLSSSAAPKPLKRAFDTSIAATISGAPHRHVSKISSPCRAMCIAHMHSCTPT